MTDFTVAYLNGVTMPYSGDAARYEINPANGVLTVFDGEGSRLHFSATAWLSVTDAAPTSAYDSHSTTKI